MTFLRGLASQAEVVYAIILRETRTRFGVHKLGYLWALLEPTILIVTFYWFLRVAGRAAPPGMDQFTFIATGVVPYTLFANSVHRVAESINGNKSLLYYPQVRPIDLMIARCLLELATFIAVFMLLLGGHMLYVRELEIDSPLLVITGLVMASLLGTGVGAVFCVLGQYTPAADRARGPVLRPLFWISGIFFTATMIPEAARGAMLANPVLHATELVRAGWFASYDAAYVDVPYATAWIMVLLFAGLALERVVRRRIEMS